ncbi:Bicyclomycin resistance protein [Posidoniimonas polymericola]|uniref:Bicyclomycin resistance protein n=1 Tax=Posidoniimonas polymericola TaxID=2528002 RepID=A0A5C5ZEY0_9BACT|nr:multidrug effflux MFS transporter [Posidoniimonas polymericola]TWT85999.1 Bicyclomycin resistance protein [Posidoniimonas polymericola]
MPPTVEAANEVASVERTQPTFVLVGLLGTLTAFSPLAIDMYLPAFPQIQRDLAAPDGTMELTLSFFLAGLAIGQFFIGPVSDRYGRRRPLLFGCCGFALASVGCLLAPSVELLIAARFAMGFAGSAGLVVSRAVVRDLFDESESASVYSLMMMVTGVAPVVAPLIGGQLLAVAPWQTVFWVLAAIGVACAAAVALTLGESLPREERSEQLRGMIGRSLTFFTHGTFLPYALAIGMACGALFAYIAAAPTVFMDHFGLSPQTFSYFFAGNAVGLVVTAQLNRRLLTRFGPRTLLSFGANIAAAAGVGLLIAAWTGVGGFWLFYALLFTCVATLGLLFPNATAAAMAPFAGRAGAASAVLGLLQYAIGAVTGSLVGLLHNGTAVPMAAAIAACELAVWGVLRTAAPRV